MDVSFPEARIVVELAIELRVAEPTGRPECSFRVLRVKALGHFVSGVVVGIGHEHDPLWSPLENVVAMAVAELAASTRPGRWDKGVDSVVLQHPGDVSVDEAHEVEEAQVWRVVGRRAHVLEGDEVTRSAVPGQKLSQIGVVHAGAASITRVSAHRNEGEGQVEIAAAEHDQPPDDSREHAVLVA